MEDVLVPIVVVGFLFVALPWLILHYITKWKQSPKITGEDEKMLDEMYMLARRLEERLNTIERIVAADNPDFRPGLSAPSSEVKPELSAPARSYQIDRRN